jgi:isoaspartyl peptidase/L-asparaginase-like protein (Ntn-hydrolase superfamily)
LPRPGKPVGFPQHRHLEPHFSETDFIVAEPIAVATWPFGQSAVRAAAKCLAEGGSALDAAIAGAQAVEDDPAVHSVGFGGLANRIGNVTLDACVMDGRTLDCGGVAGVENVRHVSALARKVMENTPHLLLVGEGAQQFAIQQGFPLESLHTAESVAEWHKRKPKLEPGELIPHPAAGGAEDHDTVTVLVRDAEGDLGGCCTTSGLAYKLPGRVGDSPLIGHGLYVDNEAGAAGGTGYGEENTRIVGSFFMVEKMRVGLSAQAACEAAAKRVIEVARRRGKSPARLGFVAIDTAGNPGSCCTPGTNFQYAVARAGRVELLKAKEVVD